MFQAISIIGGGVMGEVFVKRFLQSGLALASNLAVVDTSLERREFLARTYGVRVLEKSQEALIGADLVVLAVKPQQAKEALEPLRGQAPQAVFLSIIAGASLRTLMSLLGSSKVVRTMPNMAAQVGLGMTVWCAGSGVRDQEKSKVQQVLTLLGQELEVQDEELIDKATAVSGSGPAYVFDFADQLIGAAVELGMDRVMAQRLVAQTFKGAAHLLEQSSEEPAVLRQKVTSKGGTTEAAFAVLERTDLKKLWREALQAAYERAGQLSRDCFLS